jgi:hypothetical protein
MDPEKEEKLTQKLFDSSVREIVTSAQQIFSQVEHALRYNEPLEKGFEDLVTNIYKGIEGIKFLLKESRTIDESSREKKKQHLKRLYGYTSLLETASRNNELLAVAYYAMVIEQVISRFAIGETIDYELLETLMKQKYQEWKKKVLPSTQVSYIT